MKESSSSSGTSVRAVAEIQNVKGLHARASAKFVETVARFSSEVLVRKDGASVSGRSIMGLMMLGAAKGSTIELIAEGEDARAVMRELLELIKSKFHEDQ